jgi:hypothetical protein
MASRLATPAGFSFFVIGRQDPFSEWNPVTNVLRIVRSMWVVACPAGAAFLRFMHMHEMQVSIAVSEICQRRGFFLARNGPFMAHETKLIIVLVVTRIEERRVIFTQHPEVL